MIEESNQLYSCKLCSCEVCTDLFEKNGYKIAECKNCKLVQVWENLCDEQLNDLYDEGYFQGVSGAGYGDYLADEGSHARTARKRLREIERIKGAGGKLLEIGTGVGLFLREAKTIYDVSGVEVSGFGSKYAGTHFGLQVFHGTTEEASYEQSSFDIVVMWDVIEHVVDPISVLKEVNRIMRPSGLLVFSTPDSSSIIAKLQGRLWRLYDPPYHLHYFSQETIRLLLKESGFVVDNIKHISEYHSARYLGHGAYAYYPNAITKALSSLVKGMNNFSISLNLFDVITVTATKLIKPDIAA